MHSSSYCYHFLHEFPFVTADFEIANAVNTIFAVILLTSKEIQQPTNQFSHKTMN